MNPEQGPRSAAVRVRRRSDRGRYDRETIVAVLDEAILCHVGFVHDGRPFVVPTLHARVGDDVLIHGSSASRMLRTLSEGVDVCLTVTVVDGLVLARSAFDHSVNYRSVMLLGRATLLEEQAKSRALETLTEQLVPGRWADVRHPTPKELKATSILSLPIDEASAKVRTGPPKDEPEDLDLPVWAGVLPLSIVAGDPVADPGLRHDLPPPDYVTNYRRPRSSD